MKGLIHQTYLDLFDEMRASKLEGAAGALPMRDPYASPDFPTTLSYGGRSKNASLYIFAGAVAGVIVAGTIFYFWNRPNFEPPPLEKQLPVALTPAQKSEEVAALRGDVDLMKKILTGLVESVQALSVRNDAVSKAATEDSDDTFPYVIEIAAAKANLRGGPGRGEASIGIVPKNTVLLATEEHDGWLKVSTPKGEIAWVSKDIVRIKKD